MSEPRIGIVSYCDHVRTLAHVNHELYATERGYTYIFDIAPTAAWKYLAKMEKIVKFLPLFDWVFWIDDDAFVMDREVLLETFVDEAPDATVIMCESPDRDGVWTWVSSGNFLIRNTPEALAFLRDVIATDLEVVREWWDPAVYGKFTRGDQDAIVYLLNTHPVYSREGFLSRLPYTAFNTRPEHFERPRDHFLVHFTGGDKRGMAQEFGERFDLPESLTRWNELKAAKGIYRPIEKPAASSPGKGPAEESGRLGKAFNALRGRR